VQATKQQQIVGYFIEEAKEHLDTIEQGLINLQATLADPERMNELFRAAHSVKGGAAMLGFNGIQKVGHYLEDGFKLLKENAIQVDQRLEDLFLQGFDLLKELVEALQSPYGMREQEAEQALQTAEPMFVELQNYLNCLIQGDSAACETIPQTKPATKKPDPKFPALLNAALKKMLELFRQGDSATCRQQLTMLCDRMVPLHPNSEWCRLIQSTKAAINNSQTAYPVLAPLVIKELKQAGDLLIAGRGSEITPSKYLQQLATPAPMPTPARTSPTPVAVRQPVAPRSPATITIPAEPRAAARALLTTFNKEQLIELAEFLMKAIQ
jgi:chemotaxis protein histidine kinase CheA